jgi:hypothetical protein
MDENGPRATRRAIDEEVPGAKRRMLEGRKKEMCHDHTGINGMAGYNRARNEYLREMARMTNGIDRIFQREPTNPDDYIIAKEANEKLLAVIDERSLEEEGVTRAVLREEKSARNLRAEITALTTDVKRDLDHMCEGGSCCGADMRAKHDGVTSRIRSRRKLLSSHEDRLLKLKRRQWALAAQMKRDRARSTVLQERSGGALSSLHDRIHLARRISELIEPAQRRGPSANGSWGLV